MFNSRTVAIVTGASRGLGRSIACSLAREFSKNENGRGSVLVLVARSKAGLEETKNAVSNISGDTNVHIINGDLGDLENLAQITKSLLYAVDPKKFPTALLVNNAATIGDVRKVISSHSDVKEIHDYMGLNVTSPFYLTSQFLNVFRDSKQYVVNISSLCAIQPMASLSLYCTGKAGRDMLNQVLAEESKDVRVLNYSPGPLETEMYDDIRRNSGVAHVRQMFQDMTDTGKVLTTDASAEKLMAVLKQDRYKSGLHFDFFEELPEIK